MATGQRGNTAPPVAQQHLRAMVEAFDPQLVVVDGASDTFDGNEIVKREVRGFIKSLRKIHPKRRVAVLLIVHIDRASARGGNTSDDGYSGNVAWHNSCRRRLYLHRKVVKGEDGEDESETITLRVMKNQDGAPAPDMEVRRLPSGFWVPAVSFSGNLANTMAPEDHAPVILSLIREYYDRGQWISASLAPNATIGAYATLKGHPRFPARLDHRRTADIIRRLERELKLGRESYRTPSRHIAERWVARDVR